MLDKINTPADLKKLKKEDLPKLCTDLRNFIISSLSKTGGHLGGSLGATDLCVALHYVFNSPTDKFIFDVGYQAYVHKILTGRKHRFDTIRQFQGLSGFLSRSESPHDIFGAGHASTSLSAAMGIAVARDHKKETYQVIPIIGDGSFTGGLVYEALNNIGHVKPNMLLILNDNGMSISKNTGAVSTYLKSLKNSKFSIRDIIKPRTFFEDLGIKYFGPIDGNNVATLIDKFHELRGISGPKILHILTEKGKGYNQSKDHVEKLHGVKKFDISTGKNISSNTSTTYTDVFANTLIELSKTNESLVAITAAMPSGTGIDKYGQEFPERCYDVGIAEEHAVTFAAGLAANHLNPIVAIYSTFLQRSIDQVIHDVSLQKLPVTFCLDRAGIVGEDGETHQGMFDLTFLRMIPNLVVMAPKDGIELRNMIYTAINYPGPIAIRYPKGPCNFTQENFTQIELGKSEILTHGDAAVIFAIGSTVEMAVMAAKILKDEGTKVTVVNSRFVKPLDRELILELASKINRIITVEENTLTGGFGSAISELLHDNNLSPKLIRIGLPDTFIQHGSQNIIRELHNITPDNIIRKVRLLVKEKTATERI